MEMATDSELLPETIRAFVALKMAAEVERELARFIAEMSALGESIRWADRANLHLTLRFLGAAAPSRRIGPLGAALAKLAAHTPPFSVAARGIGAFPNLARARVIWLGLQGAELAALAEQVERAALEAGFEPERRPYSPHLTLGRVRDLRGWGRVRRALESAAGREFGTSPITALHIYRSHLSPKGSTYELLERLELGGAPAV